MKSKADEEKRRLLRHKENSRLEMSNSEDKGSLHEDESPEVRQLNIKQKVIQSVGKPRQKKKKKKKSKSNKNMRTIEGTTEGQKKDETQPVDSGGELSDDLP